MLSDSCHAASSWGLHQNYANFAAKWILAPQPTYLVESRDVDCVASKAAEELTVEETLQFKQSYKTFLWQRI